MNECFKRCDVKEIMQRCIRDRTSAERLSNTTLVLNDTPEIIGYKLREWKHEIGHIHEWYASEHQNLSLLDARASKWLLWESAKQLGFESIRHVQHYLSRINKRQAAGIAKLCVTRDELLARLGDFGQYCPVALALDDELVDCSHHRHMDFVAEYQGFYYKMASADKLAAFLAEPERFVAPLAPHKLPPAHLLPARLTGGELGMKQLELNGYCPVTYYHGQQRYEYIEQGLAEYAADYRGKVYFMVSAEALDKFMRKPELYANLRLPHKLPPVKLQMNVMQLPMSGYLEQTAADMLKRSLNACGNFKPKFPFLSPTRSALLYIAYYLKGF